MGMFFDKIINFLRWPVAMILLISIPALKESYSIFNIYTHKFLFFACGFAFFIFTSLISGSQTRRAMQTISHELTHLFFAYLTFHRAGRIRLNPDETGGSMLVKGDGNWLIRLAPYFFPLFSFIMMLIMPFLLRLTGNNWMIYAIFGYFFGYYWSTLVSQIHPQQTDIIRSGYGFSAIIIVSLNMYVSGAILAFNSKLWDGVWIYSLEVYRINLKYFEMIKDLIF